ncbi:MAG: hypothetical protein JNM57_09275 [Cyclobacteriaceae bacterium]|nr:hypothetical protein [Cyclobacteriaceae bacterium]
MKSRNSLFLIVIVLAWGCGQKSHEHDHQHGESLDSDGNQALYDEVMKVHDEVMPKMNDIYKLKEELKNKVVHEALSDEQKKEIESTISKLDSASNSMMVWMREFNPVPDSIGEEKAREYLENEMERVKKVKDNILEALAAAKEKTGQ